MYVSMLGGEDWKKVSLLHKIILYEAAFAAKFAGVVDFCACFVDNIYRAVLDTY